MTARTLKDRIFYPLQILFAILFVWFIAQGGRLEHLTRDGWSGQNIRELLRESLPDLLWIGGIVLALYLIANFGAMFRVAMALSSLGKVGEDPRMTKYRVGVRSQNFVGSLKVFCGLVGLGTFFILALVAILKGAEGGMLAGGWSSVILRFAKFGFFVACLWGLFEPWNNYLEENGREGRRRKEMIARIEADPEWWPRHDEG